MPERAMIVDMNVLVNGTKVHEIGKAALKFAKTGKGAVKTFKCMV